LYVKSEERNGKRLRYRMMMNNSVERRKQRAIPWYRWADYHFNC